MSKIGQPELGYLPLKWPILTKIVSSYISMKNMIKFIFECQSEVDYLPLNLSNVHDLKVFVE